MMSPPPPAITERGKRRGFSLIEAAVVLGVVGLVIGGIWVAAAAVNQTMKINTLYGGIVSVMTNMQRLYNGVTIPGGSTDVTTEMCKADIFPASAFVFNNNCTSSVSPITSVTHKLRIGSSLGYPGVNIAIQADQPYQFMLSIGNITATDCVNLLMKFNSSGQENIVYVRVTSTATITPYDSTVQDTVITLVEAQTACQPAVAARRVDIGFKK